MVPCKFCKNLSFEDCPRCGITHEPVEPDQYCDLSEPATEEMKPIEIKPVCQGSNINAAEKHARALLIEQIHKEGKELLKKLGRDIPIRRGDA